ncbi:MAG: hypothetical protein ACRDL6_09815 [Solirubrobacterales bacterium]
MSRAKPTARGAKRAAGNAARGTGHTVVTVALIPVIALGIPLFWVWVASQLAGTDRELTPSLAIFIATGILVSYWVAALVGMYLRGRWVGAEEDRTKLRRMSWNRSFRDEPSRAGDHRTDPVERLFVITAMVGVIAFQIWFFFFAGSPLPNQPLF